VKGRDQQVDGLDAYEGNDHPSDAIDKQVALQDLCGTKRAELYASQG
jgi:hypothetical protein